MYIHVLFAVKGLFETMWVNSFRPDSGTIVCINSHSSYQSLPHDVLCEILRHPRSGVDVQRPHHLPQLRIPQVFTRPESKLQRTRVNPGNNSISATYDDDGEQNLGFQLSGVEQIGEGV